MDDMFESEDQDSDKDSDDNEMELPKSMKQGKKGDTDDEKLEYICHSQVNLGFSTNNLGEYTAVILGLLICALNRIEHIEIRTDSELLVK